MITGKLKFLPEEHEYFLDEVKIPGVTEVLESAGFVSDYEKGNEENRQFGTNFHDTMRMIFQGKFIQYNEKFKSEGWLVAIEKFIIEQEPIAFISANYGVERILHSSKYGYAGTIDFIGMLKRFGNTLCIPDWKTITTWNKAVEKKCELQTAAYEQLFLENHAYKKRLKRLIVQFVPFDYEIHEMTDSRAWPVFLSALNVKKYKDAA
jgi:hypothetical protein